MFEPLRVERPDLETPPGDRLREEIGGQWEWCWSASLPYRAIVAPSTAVMPAAPRPGADLMMYLGYWATLQGFLTYSFGWTRHDRGLRWWYDAGRPTEDSRFALIDAVWERDGRLLGYAEWCHDRLAYLADQPLTRWTAYDLSLIHI